MAKPAPTSFIGFLAETVSAYLFWCIFVDLMPTVWFGPMSILRATDYGEEFYYLVAYLSPLLMSSSAIRSLVYKHPAIANLLPLIGIPSYLMTHLFQRTLLVCLGTLFGIIVHFSNFWQQGPRREQSCYAHLIAIVALISSRFWFHTLIPLWLNQNNMYIGLAVGVVAALIQGLYAAPEDPTPRSKTSFTTDLRFAFGFGALIFLSHWFLTAHSVFPRWLDLETFVYGLGTIAAMIVGILISPYESLTRSYVWWILAVVASPVVITPEFPKQTSIAAAYLIVCYISSVWYPAVMDLGEYTKIVRTLTIASFLYLLGHLSLIWSVAYCFVPFGGPPMRERIGQIFCTSVVLAGLAYKTSKPASQPSKHAPPQQESFSKFSAFLVLFLVVLFVTGPAIYFRSQTYNNRSGYPGVPRDYIRGMAWAIRFGYDNLGWTNFEDVEGFIRDVGANVIGLVETDITRPFNGNRDLVEYLENKLQMYSDYGPGTLNETWGCALFSVFPIIRADHEKLPSPEGENACLIDATLLVNGKPVDIIVVHIGNTEHVLDRKLQAEDMEKRVKSKKREGKQMIWLGYLTDKPGGPNYNTITQAGLVDVAPQVLNRYCIYLFHMGMRVTDFKRVDVGDVTDTEIQVANFHLK